MWPHMSLTRRLLLPYLQSALSLGTYAILSKFYSGFKVQKGFDKDGLRQFM